MPNSICICKEIQCPYFNERLYQCERYGGSNGCHLKFAHPEFDGQNEYALYLEGDIKVDIKGLMLQNNRFFLEDTKYQDDLDFFEKNADWLTPRDFQPKPLPRAD